MASSSCLSEADLRKLMAQYLTEKNDAAASQIRDLMDGMNRLKVQVGLLGERGTGVSTLVEALLNKPCRVTDAAAYFREAPEPVMHSVAHIHPTLPHLTLHDLPGFEAGEKPAAYLRRLGDLSQFRFLVMVVGDALQDHHLQVLKAIKPTGKRFLLARTKIDLDLHTAGRRLRFRYNPVEQMGLIRKELTEKLAKDGLHAENVFLVSGLETERYDFAWFEDSLEGEVLSLQRHHRGNLEVLNLVSQKVVKELYEICKSGSLMEVPAVIQATLEDPSQIRLDIAVIGEAGSGKSSLINALRGVGCDEPEAAPTGGAERTGRATAYQFPFVPNVYLWDLPGVGMMEDDVNRLGLSQYGLFLLVSSERYRHTFCLARVIASAGKESFLVRNKIDVDMEAQPGKQPSLQRRLQELVRKSLIEKLNDGVDSPVFLVSSLTGEGYNLSLLRKELQNQASELKRKALRTAIPTVVSQLVRRKAKVLLRDTWGKAQQICLFSVDNPQETVAENLLAFIASFCIDLGLNEDSVRHIAQGAGREAQQLQAEIRSPFARSVQPADVLSHIMKPPSPSLSSWAWSYVPYWGQGATVEPMISFESVYGMLKQVVVELSEDAKRLLLAAFLKEVWLGRGYAGTPF